MVVWTYPLRHRRLVDRGRRRRCSWWFVCIQISIRVAAVIRIGSLYYSVEPTSDISVLRNIKPSIDHAVTGVTMRLSATVA